MRGSSQRQRVRNWTVTAGATIVAGCFRSRWRPKLRIRHQHGRLSTFSAEGAQFKTADPGLGVLPTSDRSLRKSAPPILTNVNRLSCLFLWECVILDWCALELCSLPKAMAATIVGIKSSKKARDSEYFEGSNDEWVEGAA